MSTNNPQQLQAHIVELKDHITELKLAGNFWFKNATKLQTAAEHGGDGEGMVRAGFAQESIDRSREILNCVFRRT